jgi:hypothetical protein
MERRCAGAGVEAGMRDCPNCATPNTDQGASCTGCGRRLRHGPLSSLDISYVRRSGHRVVLGALTGALPGVGLMVLAFAHPKRTSGEAAVMVAGLGFLVAIAGTAVGAIVGVLVSSLENTGHWARSPRALTCSTPVLALVAASLVFLGYWQISLIVLALILVVLSVRRWSRLPPIAVIAAGLPLGWLTAALLVQPTSDGWLVVWTLGVPVALTGLIIWLRALQITKAGRARMSAREKGEADACFYGIQ